VATYQILIRDLTNNTSPVVLRKGLNAVLNDPPVRSAIVEQKDQHQCMVYVDYLDDALTRLVEGVKDGLLPEAMVAVIVTYGNWWRPDPVLITSAGVKYGRLDLLDAAQDDLLRWRKDGQ
jgi:hypothetical protein